MKPIISQLLVDPPSSLEQHPDVPSVNEVDDVLVSCVGQMAVTSASDLLWKPLNHEVSLQSVSARFICLHSYILFQVSSYFFGYVGNEKVAIWML